MPELEQLEKDLRKALDGVCGERDRIVQEQLAKEEQRLCVVCQVSIRQETGEEVGGGPVSSSNGRPQQHRR